MDEYGFDDDYLYEEDGLDNEREYVASHADISRVAEYGAATMVGEGGKTLRIHKTSVDHYMDDVKSRIFTDYENILTEAQKNAIIESISHITNLESYNANTLIATFYWGNNRPADYKKFYKNLSAELSNPPDKIDLWRYIRKFKLL